LAAFRFSMLWLSHHRCIDTTVEWRKYPDMATLDKSGSIWIYLATNSDRLRVLSSRIL